MSVINETGQGPAPTGLSQEAGLVYRCLAAVGRSVPVPVVAALAYLTVPLTRRHLRHLARVGVAVEVEGRFTAAPDAEPPSNADMDREAWARAVGWYATCAFNTVSALACAALPGGGVVVESAWPAPRFEDAAEACAWYEASHGELAWAAERASAVGEHCLGWHLALLIANIAAVTGPIGAWERALECGLAAASRDGRADARGMLLEYRGKLLLADGRVDDASRAQAEAIAVRSTAGDGAGVIRSTNALGLIALRRADYPVARMYFAGALDLALKAKDAEFTAFARMNLGAVLVREGETNQAKALLEAAASYQRAHERGYYLANTLQDLAAAHRIEGDHRRAMNLAVQAVAEATRAQLPLFLPGPLCELARAHLAFGDECAARAALTEARAIYAESGDVARAGMVTREINAIPAASAGSERTGQGGERDA